MTPKHLETLTEALATLKPLHGRLDTVVNELGRAYADQSGEWRWSAEGDAASEEMNSIEEITRHLEDSIEELRQFVFLLSENPDFGEMMSKGQRGNIAPLPDKLPSREEICAEPRRPGAPPYPFLKRQQVAGDD
jgi:hypothetical protein